MKECRSHRTRERVRTKTPNKVRWVSFGGDLHCPIGIGTPLTGRPSHTTVHTGPYTAIRLIKAKSAVSKPHRFAGLSGLTTIQAFQPLLQYVCKYISLITTLIYPCHSAGGTVQAFIGVSSPFPSVVDPKNETVC